MERAAARLEAIVLIRPLWVSINMRSATSKNDPYSPNFIVSWTCCQRSWGWVSSDPSCKVAALRYFIHQLATSRALQTETKFPLPDALVKVKPSFFRMHLLQTFTTNHIYLFSCCLLLSVLNGLPAPVANFWWRCGLLSISELMYPFQEQQYKIDFSN